MVRFACPSCHVTLESPEGHAGAQISCPRCQQRLLVPGKTEPTRRVPSLPEGDDQRTESTRHYRAAGTTIPPAAQPEPAPESKTKPAKVKKKPTRRGMWLAIGGGVFALFACCGCTGLAGFGIWFYNFLQPDSIQHAMKWMPDNCQALVYFRVQDLGKSDAMKDLLGQMTEDEKDRIKRDMEREAGFGPQDVDYVVMGVRDLSLDNMNGPRNPVAFMMVVRTNRKVSINDIVDRNPALTPSQVGAYTLYSDNRKQMYLSQVDSRTLVLSADQATMRAVLERNGQPKLSESFKQTVADMKFTHHMGGVFNLKSIRQLQKAGGGFPGGGGPDPGAMVERFEKAIVNDVETCIFTVDLKDNLEVIFALRYPSAESANKARAALEDARTEVTKMGAWQDPQFRRLKAELTIGSDGRYAHVIFKCDRRELFDIFKTGFRGGFQNAGGNGNHQWSLQPNARQGFRARFNAGDQVSVTAIGNNFQSRFKVLVYNPQNQLVSQADSVNGSCSVNFVAVNAGEYNLVVENRDAIFAAGNLNYFALNMK
jgi:hypothetical protein